MGPQKDFQLLIRALANVPGLEVDLIGDGPQRQALEALAEEANVSDRVRFLGYKDNVAEFLSRAHIFILASNYEGFPISILEGMRSGLPVVASDVGGVREAVIHNQTGILVPVGDVASFSEGLRRLTEDAALRERMGAAGRQRFEEQFRLEIMMERTLEVYATVTREAVSTSR